jgi:hypothetical protein
VSTLSEREWDLLLAVGARLVPEVASLDDRERDSFRAIVDDSLADRPAALQRQLRVFLGLVEHGPALRFGRFFRRLAPDRQDRVLRWLQDAPVGLLRSGFWGMKALVLMGYYARPEVGPSISYTPSFRGNEKLHA